MGISYRPYEPQREMLPPASLQDWLPKGHLAYFISDTGDALDLGAFYARDASGRARNQLFHPAMMVKVLVRLRHGVLSSRKIERRLHEDLAFRMLGAGNFPKHRTIRQFRALHLKEFSQMIADRRRQGGSPSTQVDRRATERLDQERPRVRAVQPARPAPPASRVQARMPGAEFAAHGHDDGAVRAGR